MSNLSLVNGTWVLGQAAGFPDWRVVNLSDGTWSSSDPGGNARTSGVATLGTTTTVTWNAFTGSSNDSIDGATFDGLRYYIPLTYSDGTAVQVSDAGATIEMWVDTPRVIGSARTQFSLGISENPTNTSNNTSKMSGLYWSSDQASSYVYIGQIRTSASPLTVFNTDNQYGYGRCGLVKGNGGYAAGWAIKTDGTESGINQRGLVDYTGTLYMQINMGTPSGRPISSGQTNVWSAFYRVLKTPIGPEGNRP